MILLLAQDSEFYSVSSVAMLEKMRSAAAAANDGKTDLHGYGSEHGKTVLTRCASQIQKSSPRKRVAESKFKTTQSSSIMILNFD